jgi:hypothetical protein
MHKTVKWCKDGKHLATELCPEESVIEVSVLDYDREIIKGIKAGDHNYLLKVLSADKIDGKDNKECPVHTKKWKEEEDKKKEEEDKDKPTPGGDTPPGGGDEPGPGGGDEPPVEPNPPDETGAIWDYLLQLFYP